MRTLRKLFCVLSIIVLVTLPAFADTSGHRESDKISGSLTEDGKEVANAGKTDTGYDLNAGLGKVITKGAGEIGGILSDGLSCAAKLLAIALLCGAVSALGPDGNGAGPFAVNAASALCIIVVGSVELNSTLNTATEFQNDLNLFSKVLLPTLTAAGVAAGSTGASIAKQSAALLFSDILITLFANVFVPLVYMTVALRAVGIISGNPFFSRISSSVKNTMSTVLKYLLTLYFAYISIMGIIGSAADTLAKKATKTAISTAVPVVGGVIGEAAESVFAGAALIKNSVGVFGILGILGCAVTPLLSSGISYLVLRGAAMLTSAIPENGSQQAIETLADAMSMIFGMCCASVALLLITVIVIMKISGG